MRNSRCEAVNESAGRRLRSRTRAIVNDSTIMIIIVGQMIGSAADLRV
jgi:hypothetical protein